MKLRKFAIVWFSIYLMTVVITTGTSVQSDRMKVSESDLGVMCVQAVYPSATRGKIRKDKPVIKETKVAHKEPKPAKVNKAEPVVIIYHTHATEAYRPVETDNFRTTNEECSVRDVANVLTSELESLGVSVLHDKTLHDAESYNQSYDRSLETIRRLVKENPSAVIVIDLHRDAAPYSGFREKKINVNGESASGWSLVVGQNNENLESLTAIANELIAKAEEMYPGFGGRIIEKEYKYNQNVKELALLLEIGNNESHIKNVRVTAKYFAHVLKEVLSDRGLI